MACRKLSTGSYFDRLPPELVYAILCYVPSPAALFCLLQASRCCNDVFRSTEPWRNGILQHVLGNDLELALHSQALAVWESTQLASWDDHQASIQNIRDAVQIISRLMESRNNGEHVMMQREQLIPICRLHCVIEFFIRDYACTALHLFDAIESRADRSHGWVQHDAARPRPSIHLTRLERSRLQRAFMNFELICNMVRHMNGEAFLSGRQSIYDLTFDPIMNAFPASEWEEMLCVIEYLHARVEAIFDELEQDYVHAMSEYCLEAREDEPGAIADDGETQTMTETAAAHLKGETCIYYGLRKTNHGIVRAYHARHANPKKLCKHSPDAFYTKRIKRSFSQHPRQCLGWQGLTYLKHLLCDGAKAQNEAVASILETGCNNLPVSHLFSKWLDREHDHAFAPRLPLWYQRMTLVNPAAPGNPPPPGQATQPVQNPIQTALNPPPTPPPPLPLLQRPPRIPAGKIWPDDDHDQLCRPNLGWHWSRNYLHSDITGRASDHALRRWGYVFWDADRLRKMGVTAYVHNAEPSIGEVEKRQRDEEPSAEGVLMDMGLLKESPVNLSLTTDTMPPEVERQVRERWDF